MTTIDNSVSSSLLAAMNPATTSTATGSADDAQATQDRFMTLLVAQMKNQDPLNPMDNAQVTSQMAQLSTVSGIDKLNTTLASLMGSYQSSQSLQAASMIGHGVLVPGSSTELSKGQAVLGVDLPAAVDTLKVTISDGGGNVVRSINLGAQSAGTIPFQWDGTDDKGAAAPDGKYTFQVAATIGGQSATATALSYGIVGSVSTGTDGVKVNLPDQGSVNVSDIKQIL